MKSVFEIREDSWRATVFFLWFIAFFALLATERYIAFLRPEFSFLLGLGMLALVVFMISNSLSPRQRPVSLLQFVRGCILLLPLVFLLNSGDQGLDAEAFKKRFLGPASIAATETVSSPRETIELAATDQSELSPGTPQSAIMPPPPFEGSEEVTILDLDVAPQQYMGKHVSVVGMVFQSEDFDAIFGGNSLILFRFTINCCAADSLPIYALIKGKDLPRYPDDTWVKVKGVFDMEHVDQYSIPVIDDAVLEKTETPDSPYLF